MKITEISATHPDFPASLRHIPDPPAKLYALGNTALLTAPALLTIIGSRSVTPYGKHITAQLAGVAAGKGVVIVSGLALGVDGIAHQAALDCGGKTIAVLAHGLDTIAPRTHRPLAKQILEQDGLIISEYPAGTEPRKPYFIARNRIVSGLSQAVLITEASQKSGTLHTARFALEQGRDVMAVPGNITSPVSVGTNNLIKSGAIPITMPEDIIEYYGLDSGEDTQQALIGANQEEQTLLTLLASGIADSAELLAQSGLSAPVFNQTLTMLELSGRIKPLGSNQWRAL